MMNLEVYVVADRLDIQKLKDLSKLKFQKILGPTADFPDIVRHVIQSTPRNDTGLRAVCVEICAKSVQFDLLNYVFRRADTEICTVRGAR